jgi:hypothetical protein
LSWEIQHRTSDANRETNAEYLQSQCSTRRIQGQDDSPKSEPCVFKAVPGVLTVTQLYCVRPNSGRIEPGETAEVAGEGPPLSLPIMWMLQHSVIRARSDASGDERGASTICQVSGQVLDSEHVHHLRHTDNACARYRTVSSPDPRLYASHSLSSSGVQYRRIQMNTRCSNKNSRSCTCLQMDRFLRRRRRDRET